MKGIMPPGEYRGQQLSRACSDKFGEGPHAEHRLAHPTGEQKYEASMPVGGVMSTLRRNVDFADIPRAPISGELGAPSIPICCRESCRDASSDRYVDCRRAMFPSETSTARQETEHLICSVGQKGSLGLPPTRPDYRTLQNLFTNPCLADRTY